MPSRFRLTIWPALAALAILPLAAPRAWAQRIRIKERVEDLEVAARRDTCDAAAQYNLAVGYMSRERWDLADTLLRRAVAIDPQLAEGFFALGLVQDRNNRYWDRLKREGGDAAVARERERRVAFTRKAFLVDPLVDIRLIGVVRRRSDVPNVFVQALNAIMDGQYRAAFDLVQVGYQYNLTMAGPDSLPPFVLWLHGLTAARTQQYPIAISDVQSLLRQSLARERNDSLQMVPLQTNEFRYMLAALYERAAQNSRAIPLFQQVIENDVGNYMAHVQLARISDRERDWFNAVRQRRLAVDINPEDHTLYYDLGQTLIGAARWTEAEEALLHSRAMWACYPRTHLALGITQQQLGKSDEARASFNLFLALAPERDDARIRDARERLARLP